jgi:hypothetical protein
VALPPYLSEAAGATLVHVRVQPRAGRDKVVRLPGVAAADAAERLR